jgi:hypothetical protein
MFFTTAPKKHVIDTVSVHKIIDKNYFLNKFSILGKLAPTKKALIWPLSKNFG